MNHVSPARNVKKVAAPIELSTAKETKTMTPSIVRRGALCCHSARRGGNSCPTVVSVD
jgi:hypothetical protein